MDHIMPDALSDFLDLMRVRSTAYIAKNLTAPWGVRVEEHPHLARFHLVMSGSTWIGTSGCDDYKILNQGDIAIIPNGKAHIYSDHPNHSPIVPKSYPTATSTPRFETLDTNSEDTHLLCGYFEISEDTPMAITSALPEILIGRAGDTSTDKKFDMIVDLAREELLNASSVSQVTLNRLTEILCVYTIQSCLEKVMTTDERVRALASPKMRLVLTEIHAAPEQSWTVEHLAQLVGQSRTAFAADFKLGLGTTPLRYVRQLRIKLACKMLRDSDMTIDKVAFKSGYSDTNAFNRAFKREMGTSPGAYKTNLQIQAAS